MKKNEDRIFDINKKTSIEITETLKMTVFRNFLITILK